MSASARFTGKVALVTGGSQGIGECVARRLADEGATVCVLASQDRRKAEAVAGEIARNGGKALADAADVRDARAVQAVVERLTAAEGGLHLLVNCAGVFFPTPVGATPPQDIDRMIDINLKGPLNAINAVAPVMKQAGGGKIVCVASVAAFMGVGGYALYCATKAGVAQLVKALACELAPHNINVNAIAPGNTATPMNADIRTDPAFAPMLHAMTARTPSGQIYSDPMEIAGLALYLLSEEARPMHGSTVLVDEGFSAGL